MLLEVAKLGPHPREFQYLITAGEIDLETAGVAIADDTQVRGRARRDAAGVQLEGAIATVLDIDCTRCLTAVTTRVEVEFEVSFVDPANVSSERELQLDPADLKADVLTGEEVDLNEIAREQVLLNLPEQTFCREDCRGLCERCGQNLNEGDCGCDAADIDPRWAALKELK
ncbi:MAG: YceD family protein [Pyrinomonadaceae bacterium]